MFRDIILVQEWTLPANKRPTESWKCHHYHHRHHHRHQSLHTSSAVEQNKIQQNETKSSRHHAGSITDQAGQAKKSEVLLKAARSLGTPHDKEAPNRQNTVCKDQCWLSNPSLYISHSSFASFPLSCVSIRVSLDTVALPHISMFPGFDGYSHTTTTTTTTITKKSLLHRTQNCFSYHRKRPIVAKSSVEKHERYLGGNTDSCYILGDFTPPPTPPPAVLCHVMVHMMLREIKHNAQTNNNRVPCNHIPYDKSTGFCFSLFPIP